MRFIFVDDLDFPGDIRTHPTTPFVSSEPVTFASANQASAAYPNLRSLLTIAPTVAGKSGETGNDAVMATSPVAHEVPPAITGCAMTKGCLATPADCLDKKTCQAVVSYMVDPDRSGQMKFELWRRTASNGHQYVAVGFGPVSPTMVSSIHTAPVAVPRKCRIRSATILVSFNLVVTFGTYSNPPKKCV